MLASEVLTQVRREVGDVEEDFLWPSSTIYLAIAKAQRELAFRSLALRYEESVDIPDTGKYKIPYFLFRLLGVQFEGSTYTPRQASPPRQPYPQGKPSDYDGDVLFYAYGSTLEMCPGPETGTTETVLLDGYAHPRKDPDVDNDILELPEDMHIDLVTGAAYYLHSRVDADTQDFKRLRQYQDLWAEVLSRGYDISALRNRTTEPVRYGGL